jgi:hypothetical protein
MWYKHPAACWAVVLRRPAWIAPSFEARPIYAVLSQIERADRTLPQPSDSVEPTQSLAPNLEQAGLDNLQLHEAPRRPARAWPGRGEW